MSLNYCYNSVVKRRKNKPKLLFCSFIAHNHGYFPLECCCYVRPSLMRSSGIWSSILLNDGRIAEINGSGLISLDVLFPHCTHILVSAYLHVNARSFMAKSLSGCSLRNIFKLCCFYFPSSPLSPRPYGVTSRNIYDSWLAEDLSAHSSGMAHSVSDSNISQY